ncbi:LuxR C-terminal-related transcriptional regulator [Kitasatospora sp. NPDC001660]
MQERPHSPELALARLLEHEEQAVRDRIDQLHRTQQTLAALSADLMNLRSGPESSATFAVLEGDQVVSALESAAALARREILSMHPGAPLPPEMLADSMVRNLQALDRGVQMRSIHLSAMLKVPYARAHLKALREIGVKVRVASVLPYRLIVVDRTLGYASTRPREDGRLAALEFRGADAVALLVQTFEYCWVHGAAASPGEEFDEQEQADSPLEVRERALLQMLAQGMKDEAIARSLGVSSRTLRRLIADLMQKLDVASRFQAGARAEALGWLGHDTDR